MKNNTKLLLRIAYYCAFLFVIIPPEGLNALDLIHPLEYGLIIILTVYQAFLIPFNKIHYSRLLLTMLCAVLWMSVVSIVNGNGYIETVKTSVCYFLIYFFINGAFLNKENFDLFFKVTVAYLLALCSANLVSVILFPKGIYQDEIYLDFIYILGGKNGATPTMAVSILMCSLCGYVYRGRYSMLKWWAILIACLTGLLNGSATLLILALILAVFQLVRSITSLADCIQISPCLVLVALAVLELLIVVFRVQTFFGGLFQLFGKDVTLTGRTALWETGMQMIKERPVFGYGNPNHGLMGGYGLIMDWKTGKYYSGHNALLDASLRYGIPGMIILFTIYVQPFLTINGKKSVDGIILLGMVIFFLSSLTEGNMWCYQYMFVYTFICLGYQRLNWTKRERRLMRPFEKRMCTAARRGQ